jgi:hypothetical protein
MNSKKILFGFFLAFSAVIFYSCGSAGVFNEGNMTDVKLADNNYNIVATDVHGESSAAYIIGGSMSTGMVTNIYAIARVSGTDKLYTDAINNLWKNFESKVGPVIGKNYALVNVRYDANCLNLFLYTSVKITVRADVVEFVGKDK